MNALRCGEKHRLRRLAGSDLLANKNRRAFYLVALTWPASGMLGTESISERITATLILTEGDLVHTQRQTRLHKRLCPTAKLACRVICNMRLNLQAPKRGVRFDQFKPHIPSLMVAPHNFGF